MPSIEPGREKVQAYIEANNISITDLAVAYGLKRQDLTNYLNGKVETTKGNQVILKIISDYRIR